MCNTPFTLWGLLTDVWSYTQSSETIETMLIFKPYNNVLFFKSGFDVFYTNKLKIHTLTKAIIYCSTLESCKFDQISYTDLFWLFHTLQYQ